MKQYPLAVILDIKPDEKSRLKEVLHTIRTDINANPYLRFPEITTTHFARFVLIGGGTRQTRDAETRLYFSANHDGEWEAYIDLMVDKAGAGVEAIFSACQDYPTLPLSDPAFKNRFKAFIKKYSIKVNTFYQGYPGQAVEEVHQANALRDKLEDIANNHGLDGIKADYKGDSSASGNFIGKLFEPVGRLLKKLLGFISAPLVGWLKQNATGLLYFVLKNLIRVRVFPQQLPDPTLPSPEVDTRAEVTDYLDTVQNEMTTVSEIDPGQLRALRFALWLVDKVAKFIFNKGNLGGIATIHFARWMVLDGGKNLLFESNYDGNWEQYIGDFVDKASIGMDSLWGNSAPSVNYPRYGAKDLQAFKKVIIDHQVPAAVFYSAYRYSSVRNILNDLAIQQLLNQGKTAAEFAELGRRL